MEYQKLMQDLPCEEFPVLHSDFYKKLTSWRSSIDPGQEYRYKECVYILTTDRYVPRVLKEDSNGILYIGQGSMSKNHERPGALINAVNGKTDNQHGGGNLYSAIAKSDRYPLNGMKLTLYFTDNPRIKEKELLETYHFEYGELPPLNSLF